MRYLATIDVICLVNVLSWCSQYLNWKIGLFLSQFADQHASQLAELRALIILIAHLVLWIQLSGRKASSSDLFLNVWIHVELALHSHAYQILADKLQKYCQICILSDCFLISFQDVLICSTKLL